jgi:hypothetical protein
VPYIYIYIYVKFKVISNFTIQIKVQFTLEQATRAQWGSRDIAILFLQSWRYVVVTLYPSYRRLGGA